MRISDWSADVCSSDLPGLVSAGWGWRARGGSRGMADVVEAPPQLPQERTGARPVLVGKAVAPQCAPTGSPGIRRQCLASAPAHPPPSACRSEEHTSELQSLMRISYAVFCLKKKNTY